MDRFEIATLRSYYGNLLTDRQNEMIRLRYDEDLSFGEIAEECGVSRQAVLDGLNKGVKHLEEIDGALKLVERDARIKFALDELEGKIASGDKDGAARCIANVRDILED